MRQRKIVSFTAERLYMVNIQKCSTDIAKRRFMLYSGRAIAEVKRAEKWLSAEEIETWNIHYSVSSLDWWEVKRWHRMEIESKKAFRKCWGGRSVMGRGMTRNSSLECYKESNPGLIKRWVLDMLGSLPIHFFWFFGFF